MGFPVQIISWTDEQVATLKAMWDQGLSSSKIATAIGEGCTRSSVCGKVHRLKLAQRAKRGRHAPPKPKPVKDYRRADDPPLPVLAAPEVLEAILVTMEEISTGMCRWPIGDPVMPDFRFCGCKPMIGRPYCTIHSALAYAAPRPPTKVDASGEPVQGRGHYRNKLRAGQMGLWR